MKIHSWLLCNRSLSELYLLVIPRRNDLCRVRDLTSEHLPLLKAIRHDFMNEIFSESNHKYSDGGPVLYFSYPIPGEAKAMDRIWQHAKEIFALKPDQQEFFIIKSEILKIINNIDVILMKIKIFIFGVRNVRMMIVEFFRF